MQLKNSKIRVTYEQFLKIQRIVLNLGGGTVRSCKEFSRKGEYFLSINSGLQIKMYENKENFKLLKGTELDAQSVISYYTKGDEMKKTKLVKFEGDLATKLTHLINEGPLYLADGQEVRFFDDNAANAFNFATGQIRDWQLYTKELVEWYEDITKFVLCWHNGHVILITHMSDRNVVDSNGNQYAPSFVQPLTPKEIKEHFANFE